MSTTTAITIELDQTDYDRLVTEAERRGVPPDSLAHMLLRSALPTEQSASLDSMEARKQRALAALDDLAELRKQNRLDGYPSLDAVQIVREGREELERRLDILWES